jgi:hypothetical protein
MTVPLRTELLAICRSIDAGELRPRLGAGRIWLLLAEADYPSDLDEFCVFAGLVSEIQDDPQHESAYTEDIRDEARRVIARARQS